MTSPAMPPISTTGNDRFSKILFWVGILLIPTILIIQVLVYQPFFTHMEDGRRLEVADTQAAWSALRFMALDYFGGSYGHGGAVAVSTLASWPPYVFGALFGSIPYFLTSTVIAVVITFCSVGAISRVGWQSLAGVAGFLSCFLFPPFHDLFFFPNLEERGVLFASILLFAIQPKISQIPNRVAFGVLTVIIVSLSALVKGQVAAIFFGFIIYVLLDTSPSINKRRRTYMITLSCLALAYLPIRTFLGSYSSSQQSGTPLQNLQDRYVLLMIVATFGVSLSFLILARREAWRQFAVPLGMCVSFITLVSLFGTRSFWLVPFGVMFGSAVAVVVGNLKSVKLQQLATVGLIVVTVGWTLYRIPQVFEPLHGIGAFTQGQIAKDLADEGAVIYTSCVEGSGHFNYYTERKWGVTPEFKPLEGDGAGYRFGIPDDGQYVFGDRRLCAAPGEIAEWDVVWASPGDDGFRLYKRPA